MSDPKVVTMELPSMTLAGVSGDFVSIMTRGSNAAEVIPGLWDRVAQATKRAGLHHDWSVGVMVDGEAPGVMNYTAAVRIAHDGEQPEELDPFELGGGAYLACEHIGSLESIGRTTTWFYATYLPRHHVELRDGPHLEVYDDRFNPESPDSVVLICAPI